MLRQQKDGSRLLPSHTYDMLLLLLILISDDVECWCVDDGDVSGDECRLSFWRLCRQLSIDEYSDMYNV